MCLLALQQPKSALVYLDALLAAQTSSDDDNAVSVAQTSLLRAKGLKQMGDLRGALSAAREAHGLFSTKFGDSDMRTRECFAQVNRLTAEAVQKARTEAEDRRKLQAAVSSQGALPVA
jgi:hypothetical protein